MSGERGPSRSSCSAASTFWPLRLMWSSTTISEPGRSVLSSEPTALVTTSVCTPSSDSSRTGKATSAWGRPSYMWMRPHRASTSTPPQRP